MKINERFAVACAIGSLCLTIPPAVTAQQFPAKPLSIVVNTAPGGSVDFLARIYANELGKRWNQTVVVENKPGVGGLLGAQITMRAAPDGHNLLLTPVAVLAAPLFQKVQLDAEKDFAAITQVASSPQVCITSPESPGRTWAQMLAYAKANPGKMNMVPYLGTSTTCTCARSRSLEDSTCG
jgi:tripartite-type tricarboxylate transporter receptor subunit TctC